MQIGSELTSDVSTNEQHPNAGTPTLRLGLVRHGQTEWNLHGRFQGSSNIPLNDTGRNDAAIAAAALRGGPWDTVFSSTLARAAETADIIAATLGIRRGSQMADLGERAYGEAEGLTVKEIEERWPRTGPEAPHDVAGVTLSGRAVPGVEPVESLRARGYAALAEIAEAATDGSAVIVVCHGTIIRVLLADIIGHSVPQMQNGELRELELRDGAWKVIDVSTDTGNRNISSSSSSNNISSSER